MIQVKFLHFLGPELVGYIPEFLNDLDPRPAAEQFNTSYAHGGGWKSFKGFEMLSDFSIKYPGDPAIPPVAEITMRDERVLVYHHAWVAIVQTDGTYEISRMD